MDTTEIPVYEAQVWTTIAEIMGTASVYKRGAWFTVECDPFLYADKHTKKGFRSLADAKSHALDKATQYMQESIAWMKENESEYEDPEFPFENEFSIQEVEN